MIDFFVSGILLVIVVYGICDEVGVVECCVLVECVVCKLFGILVELGFVEFVEFGIFEVVCVVVVQVLDNFEGVDGDEEVVVVVVLLMFNIGGYVCEDILEVIDEGCGDVWVMYFVLLLLDVWMCKVFNYCFIEIFVVGEGCEEWRFWDMLVVFVGCGVLVFDVNVFYYILM